ncbi:hypothetical protein PoB_005851600 [Plakobranchus ocellatus]|uniref:Uncharacterized protein n=1 Tax=Plakobranchus ocellatus TaxID=259542 RepID=A0AAV4CKC8_9GAST|nr:hypothetical protein PoB_005851600 [Plakobranchus ocellatus]
MAGVENFEYNDINDNNGGKNEKQSHKPIKTRKGERARERRRRRERKRVFSCDGIDGVGGVICENHLCLKSTSRPPPQTYTPRSLGTLPSRVRALSRRLTDMPESLR